MNKKQSDLQLALLVYRKYPRPLTSKELIDLFPETHGYNHYYIDRRSSELWSKGLIQGIGEGKGKMYEISEFGKTVSIDTIDQLQSYRKMIKKGKSDKMRSVLAESEVKSENKVLNTVIEKEAPQIQPVPFLKKLKFLLTNKL